MQISTLLKSKGSFVATIDGDASLADAVEALRSHGVGALVVSADGQRIDGILSERDVVRALAGNVEQLLHQPVRSIMTAVVATCTPDSDVEALMSTMTERRIRHVPVVAEGDLAGIVSIGDVVKNRIEELERDRRDLVDYINAR